MQCYTVQVKQSAVQSFGFRVSFYESLRGTRVHKVELTTPGAPYFEGIVDLLLAACVRKRW